MAEVDSLEIRIAADSTNAAANIDALARSLHNLNGASKSSGSGLSQLAAGLKTVAGAGGGFSQLASDIDKIRSAGVGAAGGVAKVADASAKIAKVPGIAALEKALLRVERQAEKDGNALLALQLKLDDMRRFEGIGTPETAAGWSAQIREVEKEVEHLASVVDDLDARRRTLQAAIKEAGNVQPIETLSTTLQRAQTSCEGVTKAAQTVGKSMETTAGSAKDLGTAIEESADRGKSGFSKLLDMLGKMSVRMLLLRGIRSLFSGIGDGLKQAAAQNEQVNRTLSSISSSVQYVRDALVAAILPAIEAIAPILTTILDGLAQIFNFVAKIIGFLTGQKSVVQATKQQKDFAGSLEQTATAAKAALKYLLPIDELNIMDDSGGGGGGGNVTPGGLHFEDTNLDLPDFTGGVLPSPTWSPNPVPAPEFVPVTVPEWSAQELPSPVWSPGMVPAPVFQPLPVPEYAGELIPSPAWAPALVPSPVFLPVEVPALAGEMLPTPAWAPNPVPSPGFQPVELPGWALGPLPVPQWDQDPVRAPVLDAQPLQAGLETLKAGFAAAWSTITAATAAAASQVQAKLETMQGKLSSAAATAKQTVSQFLENTKANVTAWAGSMQTNFQRVGEYIRIHIFPALDTAKSAFLTFFQTTAGFMSSWGLNLGTNLKTTLTYIPAAVAAGLTAAAASVSSWVNGTAANIKAWGENLIKNGATAISGFVKNFISGLSSAWEAFKSFMTATGEKISSWWSANKSWAAPVAAAGLATLAVGAVVLTGGVSLPTIAMAAPALALASGGVATEPTTALIGEYPGARSNPEIVAPQSILRDTFRQELNNDEIINVILAATTQIVTAINNKEFEANLDGEKIAKRVTTIQEQRNRMYRR